MTEENFNCLPDEESRELRSKELQQMNDILQKAHFKESFKYLQYSIYDTAVEHGWWETERNDGEMLMLMVSELTEALEALRHGNPPDDKIPQYNGVTAELADCVIRIMDYAYQRGFPLADAILDKHEFNKSRPYKHGGKKF